MHKIKAVTKPSKQRKNYFNAPDHIRYKNFSAPLSSELKTSHGVRSFPLKVGDTVKVSRGDNKGFEGKISRVNRKKYQVFLEGLTRETVDGTTFSTPLHPSKVVITKISLDDKLRKKILERKKTSSTKIKNSKESLNSVDSSSQRGKLAAKSSKKTANSKQKTKLPRSTKPSSKNKIKEAQ